ncbi:MAG: hypothetical protein CM15mV25_1350 [uncultured marine virus]|nr:MAG: hypothetical protein CM15mV25_1350 [uncultured marine virus]
MAEKENILIPKVPVEQPANKLKTIGLEVKLRNKALITITVKFANREDVKDVDGSDINDDISHKKKRSLN